MRYVEEHDWRHNVGNVQLGKTMNNRLIIEVIINLRHNIEKHQKKVL